MSILALGVNHKTASIDLREKLAFAPEHIVEALVQAKKQARIEELAILSTCNRTELYCALSGRDSATVLDWWSHYHRLTRPQVQALAYEHWEEAAVRHVLRVASGLDSLVLGEPQILGQIKAAYSTALSAQTLGPGLSKLFQHTFSVAKQVRSSTDIGINPVSVAYAGVSLAKHIFADLSKARVLLVGAGETIELVARHFRQAGVREILVANRTYERACEVALKFEGHPMLLLDLPARLPEVDIVVSSTASTLPIIGKGMVEAALKLRKHRPVFMIDLAVPRDIEPEVGDLNDIYLYTVDDLQETVQENRRQREEAAHRAESIIAHKAAEYMSQLRELGAVETLRQYRQKMESIKDQELTRALVSLNRGGDPQEVLKRFGNALVNKIMHEPSIKLKETGAQGRHDLLAFTRNLFGLSEECADQINSEKK